MDVVVLGATAVAQGEPRAGAARWDVNSLTGIHRKTLPPSSVTVTARLELMLQNSRNCLRFWSLSLAAQPPPVYNEVRLSGCH